MRPYIDEIRLKDSRSISLESESVLAVVGPNNSGKTHFLRTVVAQLHGAAVDEVEPGGGLIEDIDIKWSDDGFSADELLSKARSLFVEDALGNIQVHNGVTYPGGNSFRPEAIGSLGSRSDSLGIFSDLFVQFDDAVKRVGETEPKTLVPPGRHKKQSLVQRARESEEATVAIQHYFRQIFGLDVSYYDRGYGDVGFILAGEVDAGTKVGGPLTEFAKAHMEASPKLWLQGLGMRSVLGLLLRIFAQDQPILVLDEPEAFLHPPQSSALGAVLGEIARNYGRQIILSTHDRHILQGLTRSDGRGVHIERLDQFEGRRVSVSVSVDALSNARATSLVRFSPMLDSLFTKATVLVENETDAFFYSALLEGYELEADLRPRGLSPEDFLFLGVGGKAALGRTASLVRKLHSKVLVVADFDLVFTRKHIDSIADEVDESQREAIGHKYAVFQKVVKEFADRESIPVDGVMRMLKNSGLTFEDDAIRAASGQLMEALDGIGVFVCQVGELEDFDSSLKERVGKAEWVREALVEGLHKSEEARKLASRIISKFTES